MTKLGIGSRFMAGALLLGTAFAALPLGFVVASDLHDKPHVLAADYEGPAARPRVFQHYDPSPALWKLSDEDTTIYLFGTFHVLPPEFRWRTAQFDRIVAEADELIVESSDFDTDVAEFETSLANLFAEVAARTPTSERLSEDAAIKWLNIASQGSLPAEAIDRMPPLFALISLGFDFSFEAGSVSEAGVETVLEAEFSAAGKPIGSIEEPLPIFAALLGIDEQVMIDQLEQDLASWDGQDSEAFFAAMAESGSYDTDDLFAAEHAWAQGKVPADADLFGDTPLDHEMRRILLTDRNRAWAHWLDNRLDRPGTVLVAVGAGHFEGKVSVQAMLAQRGLTIQRIN